MPASTVISNLDPESGGKSTASAFDGASNFIKVYVRVRPVSEVELVQLDPVVVQAQSDCQLEIQPPKQDSEPKRFTFDLVFLSLDPTARNYCSQEQVMEEVGEDVALSAVDGYNSCVFAYGQTGSGKTYTMLGGKLSLEDANRGLLSRVIESIFRHQSEIEENSVNPDQFRSTVSFFEIYNEQIRDLLGKQDDVRVEVRHNPRIGAFVPGLHENEVRSMQEVNELLVQGVQARAMGSTLMNKTSSRSHCILLFETTRTCMRNGKSVKLRSKVNLVDLAGSERSKRTRATAERMREGAMINQSLSTLAIVVTRLASVTNKKNKKQVDHIPFRNSKLTFLLQDSLHGNSITKMIANIAPVASSYSETLSTLNFARSVKSVRTVVMKNEEEGATIITELEQECDRLRKLIADGAVSPDQRQELEDLETIKEKYGTDLEGRLAIAKKASERRKQILNEGGLTTGTMGQFLGLEETPQLLNVCYDQKMNGCLVYFLPKDEAVNVGTAVDCKILLPGVGMQPCMATIINQMNSSVALRHVNGRVLVNGREVRGKVRLNHNDRLIFGFCYCFRLNIPWEATQVKKQTSCKSLESREFFQEAMGEVLPKTYLDKIGSQAFMESMRMALGGARTEAFMQLFREVCLEVEEANVLMLALRTDSLITFSPELLAPLYTAENPQEPECVIRVKRVLSGKARLRHFVEKHFMISRIHSEPQDRGANDTVMLLALEEFRETLRDLQDMEETRRCGNQQLDNSEYDVGNMRDQLTRVHTMTAREELIDDGPATQYCSLKVVEHLQKEHALAEKRIQSLEEQADEMRAALENANISRQNPSKSSSYRPPQFGSSSSSEVGNGNKSVQQRLLEQVGEAFDQGLQRGAEQSRFVLQYIEKLKACEAQHLQCCHDLQKGVRREAHRLRDHAVRRKNEALQKQNLDRDVVVLRQELQEAHVNLEEQRADTEMALEMAEFYLRTGHQGHMEASEIECAKELMERHQKLVPGSKSGTIVGAKNGTAQGPTRR